MYRRLAMTIVWQLLIFSVGSSSPAAEVTAVAAEQAAPGAEQAAPAAEQAMPAAAEETPTPAEEQEVDSVAGDGGSSDGLAAQEPLPDEPPEAAQSADSPQEAEAADGQPAAGEQPVRQGNLVRMTEDYDLWIDTQRRLVVVDGEICLREGMLEMFACPRGTKEHESIVSVNCPPRFVHAALLAVGAEPGRPVQFAPEYVPADGPVIHVWVLWIDEQGQRRRNRAQDWIKNLKTEQPMVHDWVFAGSGFWFDEHAGQRQYYADGGDFICVANFTTAMMDLPVKSPQDNIDLLFTAYTERIPPLGTRVRLVLIPEFD